MSQKNRPQVTPVQIAPSPARPIYPATVYECADIGQADRILGGSEAGYVYSRDGHPNADALSSAGQQLHKADWALVTSSGMSALAVALLAFAKAGDHLVVSSRLYGKSLVLLRDEAARLGIACTVVDTCDLAATKGALRGSSRLLVAETICNPTLWVGDINSLAEAAHAAGCQLLIDNTFAGPEFCRPLELGADLVMESLTKSMNGHSDVLLGLLCGRDPMPERMLAVRSTWGFTPGPFECWLAERGLKTYTIRARQSAQNAQRIAEWLTARPEVSTVHYPGLSTHPEHDLAVRQFHNGFGSMVTFSLRGGRAAADVFAESVPGIPLCPSLGELQTTFSHPTSTSHRGLSDESRRSLGIDEGMIRLSVGIEPVEGLLESLGEALDAVAQNSTP